MWTDLFQTLAIALILVWIHFHMKVHRMRDKIDELHERNQRNVHSGSQAQGQTDSRTEL